MSMKGHLLSDDRLSEEIKSIIEEIFEDNKKVTIHSVKPKSPTDDQKKNAREGTLVRNFVDEVEYVLNPVSYKWVKSETPVGKVLMKLMAAH